jgi:hypothetical protein
LRYNWCQKLYIFIYNVYNLISLKSCIPTFLFKIKWVGWC